MGRFGSSFVGGERVELLGGLRGGWCFNGAGLGLVGLLRLWRGEDDTVGLLLSVLRRLLDADEDMRRTPLLLGARVLREDRVLSGRLMQHDLTEAQIRDHGLEFLVPLGVYCRGWVEWLLEHGRECLIEALGVERGVRRALIDDRERELERHELQTELKLLHLTHLRPLFGREGYRRRRVGRDHVRRGDLGFEAGDRRRSIHFIALEQDAGGEGENENQEHEDDGTIHGDTPSRGFVKRGA